MKKRAYRTVAIEDVDVARVVRDAAGERVVVAIDVAKVDMVAAVAVRGAGVLTTFRWKNPQGNRQVVELVRRLQAAGLEVEAAMEPSGTYGDVLRHQLLGAGLAVFRVSGNRTHDAAELYDGVPSLHDAKSAAIIAKLHFDGLSSAWTAAPAERRGLQAAIAVMQLHQEQHLRLVHQLESWLARHWPELTTILELTSATLLALLARIGGPLQVASDAAAARKLIHGMSHGLIDGDKAEAVVRSAQTTTGVRLLEEELVALSAIAEESHRSLRQFKKAKARVEQLGLVGAALPMSGLVGKTTAAVLVSDVGDPTGFTSTRAYLKACGLNLKEKSSGKLKGRLTITQRGPSRARQYLWLAACRLLRADGLTRAWYEQKVKRDGGKKSRAVVAVMRKLAKAIFHVARGAPFDSAKLFDAERLRKAA